MKDAGKVLNLGGKTMRCIDRLPMGMIFDLAEAMQSGVEMQAIAAMSKMLKTVVVEEDLALLSEVLHDVKDPVGFEELNNAIGAMMVQYSKRPLGQPSPSSRGSEPTGGTRKVVSLQRGTVKEDATSSKDGSSIAS